MKNMKRMLAMLLAIVMIVGLLPMSVFAAESAGTSSDPIYVLAGGDFQAGDNGQEDHYYSRINMGNILDKIKETYSTMDGFLFVGDYDGDSHNDSNAATGIVAMMEEVSERYSNLNHDNSVLIEGNHETGAVSGIDPTGGYEFDGYAVYAINETDYCEKQTGKGTQIQTVADNLETWLNDKLGEGYDAPIFVITHVPLAYGTRTYTNGDGLYAKYVFDVLNTAAGNGLNIIFLHGHDHAYGADNYLGGEAIYLPVGDKINICVPGDATSWTEETLNFTYMNAGYVGYYNEDYYNVNSYEAEKLTMTVFKIENNQVTVERISKDGTYNLKSAGREGFYSNASTCSTIGLSYNTTVYTSPQTITLQSNNNETAGTNGNWVGVTGTLTEDVTTSGGDWVEIIAPVPGTEAVPESTTYKYVLDTDGVNAGENYLILNTSSDGTAYALTNNNGSSGRTQVTISDGEIIVEDKNNIEWTFSSSTSGTVGNDGRYVYPNNGSLSLNTSGTNMTISNQSNGAYRIYRTADNYNYYLRYNNNEWTGSRTRQTNSIGTVYLFVYDSIITTPGTEATPDQNGTYGKIVGDLTYTVPYAGYSEAMAMDALKAQIDGYYYEAMSTPDEDVIGTKVDDSALTWEWVDTYDANTPGDYAVNIYYEYNGTKYLLGTAKVIVPATTTYYIAEGNGMYYVDMNTTADNAMAVVKAGITVSSATDAEGTGKTAISDDEVTWTWVDTYNGADSGPYTVDISIDGTSLGTVEVRVNVKYTTGLVEGWTKVGESEATGGKYYQRVESLSELQDGEQYLIILDCSSQTTADAFVIPTIVTYSSGSSARKGPDVVVSDGITDNTTITGDYDDYLWTFTESGTGWKIGDGSQYINVATNSTTSRGELSLTSSGETLTIASASSNPDDADSYGFAIYDSSNLYWQYNTSATLVYATDGDDYSSRFVFYKVVEEEVIPGGTIYASLSGNTVYTVEQGTSKAAAWAAVKAGITGYISSSEDGSDATELEDSALTWTWKNTYVGSVTGSYWVEISYNGVVLGTVEVQVEPGVINNYPEYPDEGAVKVNKTATGIDFQSSGIAQVEISASGVPIKKGVDLIIMLDTSSSMTSHTVTGSTNTRAQVLEEALKNLIAQLKTPGDDGQLLDIYVAIADFNGFYGDNHSSSGTAYDRDAEDMMSDDIYYDANSEAQIYTGDGTLGAGAFISNEDLAASYTLNYTSGTNYDYAMDAIYQMATAKKEANGNEERDLFIIFMSDGAAMQWNYYHSQGASSLWNSWITGAWDADDLTADNLNCTTHAYYYDEVDHDGDGMLNEHRMANAIKGDPDKTYEVIRKTSGIGTATGEENMYMVPGLGATMFAISFDAQADTNVTEESMDKSIASLASDQTGTTQYYYKVTSAEELASAFTAIGNEVAYAASNARFVDQMGSNFNMQMSTSTYTVVDGTSTAEKTLAPVIEIISYDIYTRQDYLNGTITEDKIGDRKGTSSLLEVVKFSDDGTKAYSSLIDVDGDGTYGVTINSDGSYTISDTDDNIIGSNGIIYAKTFVYNTTALGVAVEGLNIPTGTNPDGTTTGYTNVLPSETFYWKLGTVQTSELAMRYYVYLDGSMEGTKAAGSYATNNFAVLYYDNYLGNACYKDTVSPTMAWKEASVSYAFYLVDDEGNIIVNQTTGATGSFANKIAVTNPVVYETILLNNLDSVRSITVKDNAVLPEGYKLYDDTAVYTITINSNTTGSWVITQSDDKVDSTYVTQYHPNDASAYNNTENVSTVGYDYTHTVVWFAVLWEPQALPDSVVVDYGLPVDIHVLTNDMFGEKGTLAGVGAYVDTDEDTDGTADMLEIVGATNDAYGFTDTYTGKYGTVEMNKDAGTVRYTLTSMSMSTYDKFAYAVYYDASDDDYDGYYYDTVTVIPATTIYYEESFLAYSSYTWDYNTNDWALATDSLWAVEGTADTDKTQDEDRPGKYSLTDANNIYGYDAVNLSIATYSLGAAMKATVDYDHYAQAEFTFTGTGFDIISMTSNTTGAIFVDVLDANRTAIRNVVVDTYYGYKQEAGDADGDGTVEDGELVWVVDPDASGSIYQVPVIKVENLSYGTYTVVIKASYDEIFDHVDPSNETGSYEFYLDAIRIYDPANDGAADSDSVIEDAYKADGEGWPSYKELRNMIIAASSFDNVANDALDTDMEGLVFIDGDASVGDQQVADYINYGPNNEVYLAPGQRVAFIISAGDNLANVHIGLKSADGKVVTYTITNVAKEAGDNVEAGTYYNPQTSQLDTTTDMYYSLTDWKDDIIVISNTGDKYGTEGILSITNIKFTYTSDPNATTSASDDGIATASVMMLSAAAEETQSEETSGEATIYMTASAAALTLRAVGSMYAPEVFEPEQLDVEIGKDKIKEGDKVDVTVRTSDDVAYITVNGQTVTKYRTDRRSGERIWKLKLDATEAGEMSIEVVAYDADNVASEPIVETVTVEERRVGKGHNFKFPWNWG